MENIDNIKLYLPNWLEEFELVNFFEKHYRYIMLYGGRGSGKTYLIALYLILQAISKEKQRILCTRQFQASLKKSVGACLIMIIHSLGLRKHFKITNNEFVYKPNESEFLFKGFDRNKDTIKGYQGLTHVWIEEADSLTQESWDLLKPTVFRSSNSESKLFSKESFDIKPTESKSQIIITMNAKYETDCLYKTFVTSKKRPKDSYVKLLNWNENPFFNISMHKERIHCLKTNPEIYNHIWEGQLLQYSDAQIFKDRWFVQDFEEDKKAKKYYGIDFGFSGSALAIIKCYVKDDKIYVTHEYKGKFIESHLIYEKCIQYIPGIKSGTVYADCAMPSAIATLKRQGLLIKPSNKSAINHNSTYVKDCIQVLRNYTIIVRPECINMISNLQLYSFEVDPKTDLITDKIVKKHDDFIDALKYALEPIIRKTSYNHNAFDSPPIFTDSTYPSF